ncbi:hypothetical protein EJB05_02801 [Eragrostis curvula]|uniref:Uncharacterized protein n=1 Tax=Eragrostis curvula TaxID=38414 RepID=A0A5J9WU86_9POAL|nr:hypothetical protein EJB05_02801 [Eragrostis curvula]
MIPFPGGPSPLQRLTFFSGSAGVKRRRQRGSAGSGEVQRREENRGEHDAPRTSEPTEQQHLYLVFDDWPWGYSIRKLNLPPRVPRQPPSLRPLEKPEHKRLPPPCVCLEATRGLPLFFGAVGTNIIAAHPRTDVIWNTPVPERILPIFDVRSLGVRFGPALLCSVQPIFITVGDKELFALDMESFRMLSMEPLCPPHEWSWCDDLPPPPFNNMDTTSFVVGSDERTIFASTESATFAFDIVNSEWKQSSDCSLPFAGPANYVHALDIFVGLSKDPDTYGHLCFCRKLGGGDENVRPGKENLLSKDPAEGHEGATLVYLGGSDQPGFCLVECLSIADQGKSVNMRLEECDQLVKCVGEGGANCGELDQLKKNNVDERDGASGSMHECGELDELKKFVDVGDGASGSMHDIRYRYLYRLTTFSLSFDNNGDLTTGETCVVQCYKVPEEVSNAIYLANPVAFWL